ncbi:hypothetical protein cyc_03213 [Cyclospora cayetanensis]|uniref:Uncharacterized protein n=1 Tax=Cyclospora cayetanensis TaxID=88456 RepID=A0A1D3D7D2_9EIME|nr:hypothetical protein cyc_03213 [Cyclospora cayetanensis]
MTLPSTARFHRLQQCVPEREEASSVNCSSLSSRGTVTVLLAEHESAEAACCSARGDGHAEAMKRKHPLLSPHHARFRGGPPAGRAPQILMGILCTGLLLAILYAVSLQFSSSASLHAPQEPVIRLFTSKGPCSNSASTPVERLLLEQNMPSSNPLIRRLDAVPDRELKSLKDASYREVIGVILIALASIVAVCAGTGGGAVYVPLMTLIMGFSAHEATVTSQALMSGGVLAGTLLGLRRSHPEIPHRPLIDMDLLSTTSAVQLSEALSTRRHPCSVQIEESEKGCWTLCPLSKWLILGLLWLVDVGLAVIRGSKYSSFHLVPFCGWEFWLLYAAGAALMLTASAHRGYLLVARDRHWEANGTQKVKGDLVFTHSVAIQFFFQSICAGMIGGIVGIGGSMVMGPLMLARGLLPSVVTAVNTASVLSSSSSAAIKSLINGSVPWDYCLLFCCMCFAAALIGKFLVDRVVKKKKADHYLVLFLLAMIIGSMACMLVSGTIGIIRKERQSFQGPC